MTPIRFVSVLLVVIGLGGISIALGLIHRDTTEQARARAQLAIASQTNFESIDEDNLLSAWDGDRWPAALAAGTLGVMSFGGGAMMGLYLCLAALVDRDRARPVKPA